MSLVVMSCQRFGCYHGTCRPSIEEILPRLCCLLRCLIVHQAQVFIRLLADLVLSIGHLSYHQVIQVGANLDFLGTLGPTTPRHDTWMMILILKDHVA